MVSTLSLEVVCCFCFQIFLKQQVTGLEMNNDLLRSFMFWHAARSVVAAVKLAIELNFYSLTRKTMLIRVRVIGFCCDLL